jgi:hypothetical protein
LASVEELTRCRLKRKQKNSSKRTAEQAERGEIEENEGDDLEITSERRGAGKPKAEARKKEKRLRNAFIDDEAEEEEDEKVSADAIS